MSKRKATDEERERVSFIVSRASTMRSAKDRYSRRWPDYERVWKLFDETRQGEDSWRAVHPDTWAFATIKTAQSAFANSKVRPVFSRHEDEDSAKPQDLRDLYEDNAQKGDLDMELYYARLDSFKLGMGFLETIYLEDRREVQNIKKFNPETNEFTYKKEEIKDFDDPKTRRVSPYFMLIDEACRADFGNTARDCIRIEVLDWEDAKNKYEHLIDNWDERIVSAGGIRLITDEINRTGVAQTADTNTGDARFRDFQFFAPLELLDRQVEILHYWNKIEDTYEIVINGEPVQVQTKKTIAPNPYISKQLPFTTIPYSPYSGDEFWAAGR